MAVWLDPRSDDYRRALDAPAGGLTATCARSSSASREARVTVAGETVGAIGPGLLVLLGVGHDDDAAAVANLAGKVARLRIFADEAGHMNRSVLDTGGAVLAVSQFTLLADTRKGNRPSFIAAAPPERAEPLYEALRRGPPASSASRSRRGASDGRWRSRW